MIKKLNLDCPFCKSIKSVVLMRNKNYQCYVCGNESIIDEKYSESEILDYGNSFTIEEKQNYYDELELKYNSQSRHGQKFVDILRNGFSPIHPIMIEFVYHFYCDLEEKNEQ